MKIAINGGVEQNLLQQELEKLKADYQNLFDKNPLAMLVADNRTSKFIAVNKSALNTYGYTRKEFLDLTLADLAESRDKIKSQSSCYTCHYKKSGEALYVEVKKSEIVYDSVPSQLITINDVTGKVLAEDNERKARQRLDAIFRGTHDAILLADDMGRYIQVNDAACFLLKYTEAELLSLGVDDLVVSMKAGNDYKGLWDKFLESGNQSGIIELKKKSGDVVICHYNATSNVLPGLHLSIIRDITETEIGRRKIEQQAKYIDNIIESITDCFFAVNDNWLVQYWNKAAEELLQKPREEVIGYNLWDIYKDAVGLKFYHEYHRAMKTRQPVHFEEYYPAMDIWLDVSAYPAMDGLTVYFRNITKRKKQALEMLQIKNNQATLINSTTDLIWSVNDKLQLVSFNDAFNKRIEKMTGKPATEGLQLAVKFLDEAANEQIKSLYYLALQGEAVARDIPLPDFHSGELRVVEMHFNPVYRVNSGDIIGVACYSHDITERVQYQQLIEEKNKKLKSNEEHLQKLTRKLEKVMNASLDIICSFDKSGRFTQVSEASNHVLGYCSEEMVGKFVMDFIDPEYLPSTVDAGMLLVEGKDLVSFENVFLHKNGKQVYLNWSARWDADEELIFAVGRDETERQEAEKMKLVAEQRFTSLVQKGADMVGVIDTEGSYKFVSPNIESVLGYKPGSLLQKNAFELIHPDDVQTASTELQKVIKGGEVKLAAFRFKDASGEWRWIETIATNQLTNPAIKGIVVNSRDITSRKEIETERELMIKELLKSNSDLKQFSFITSHNLRAPLSNIIGILNIIDYSVLDDYNKQMIEMLDISTKQLQQTIADLSKILVIKNNVNIEVSSINLEESIEEVKTTFINTINDVCAHISTDFKVKEIQFNKTYLQSILVNLLSNSIKYQSPKRNLAINLSTETNASGYVIFKFSDNGSGIDLNRHKDKVFGLYQRFHDDIEGHGLGLFIIKSQIVALGGKIDVESQPDKGTTFTITFRNHSSLFREEESSDHSLKHKRVQTSLDL